MTGSAGQNSSNATKLLATPDSDGPVISRAGHYVIIDPIDVKTTRRPKNISLC